MWGCSGLAHLPAPEHLQPPWGPPQREPRAAPAGCHPTPPGCGELSVGPEYRSGDAPSSVAASVEVETDITPRCLGRNKWESMKEDSPGPEQRTWLGKKNRKSDRNAVQTNAGAGQTAGRSPAPAAEVSGPGTGPQSLGGRCGPARQRPPEASATRFPSPAGGSCPWTAQPWRPPPPCGAGRLPSAMATSVPRQGAPRRPCVPEGILLVPPGAKVEIWARWGAVSTQA